MLENSEKAEISKQALIYYLRFFLERIDNDEFYPYKFQQEIKNEVDDILCKLETNKTISIVDNIYYEYPKQ